MLETLTEKELSARGFDDYRAFVTSTLDRLPPSDLVGVSSKKGGLLQTSRSSLYRVAGELGVKAELDGQISYFNKGQIRTLFFRLHGGGRDAAIRFAGQLEAAGYRIFSRETEEEDGSDSDLDLSYADAPQAQMVPFGEPTDDMLPGLLSAIAHLLKQKESSIFEPQERLAQAADRGYVLDANQVRAILGFKTVPSQRVIVRYGFQITRIGTKSRRREYRVTRLRDEFLQ